MGTVLKYIFGVILVLGIGSLAVKSIASLVGKVRDFIQRKKSPVEGTGRKDVNAPPEAIGKEVDKQ